MPPSPLSRPGPEQPSNASGNGSPSDRIPLLALLEPALRREVRQRLTRRRIAAGRPVFRQGEPAETLYLIDSGRLRVAMGERAGRERVLQFLGPGEIVGEAAFMASAVHISSAVAVDETMVWQLARRDFEVLLGEHHAALR